MLCVGLRTGRKCHLEDRQLRACSISNERIPRWRDCSGATRVFRAPSGDANGKRLHIDADGPGALYVSVQGAA